MASTKLRLLLDASISDPLAQQIVALVPPTKYVRKIPELKGKVSDEAIVAWAKAHRYIVVAVDADFNASRFPWDKHVGIIRFNVGRGGDDQRFKSFRAFYHSGKRKEALNSFTYLTEGHFEIRKRTGEVIRVFLRKKDKTKDTLRLGP